MIEEEAEEIRGLQFASTNPLLSSITQAHDLCEETSVELDVMHAKEHPSPENADFTTINTSAIFQPEKENVSPNATEHETKKRSRIASPETWKSNIRKKARNSGEEHINSSKKLVFKKNPKSVACKCNFECSSFSEAERENLCYEYWASGSYSMQREYIARMVTEERQGTRRVSREYFLQVNSSKRRVCRAFFLSTLDLGVATVACTLKKVQPNGMLQPDKRGLHNSLSGEKKKQTQEAIEHIQSFPTMESHYCRKNSQRKYLDADLNRSKMYEHFAQTQEERGSTPLSKSAYRRIFKTKFNLAFHRPKKDTCMTCNKLEDDPESLAAHREKASRARLEKEMDKQRAEDDKSFHTYSFDLQSVLYTPCSTVSSMYYMRKLCVYNLCVFDQNTKDGTCFVWDETNGKRGACEIGTTLYIHLSGLAPSVQEVSLFSDSCVGQNRNQFICVALLKALHDSQTLKVITQNFLHSGHTEMEVDAMHSAIEKAKKHVSVFVPNDWYNILCMARRSKPYTVLPLEYIQFLNLKGTKLKDSFKVDREGKPVRWNQIVSVRVSKEDPDNIWYKYDFDNPYRPIRITPRALRGRAEPTLKLPEVDQMHLYRQPLPISHAKKRDLLKLCSDLVIPSCYHGYYNSLPSGNLLDRLPEPDIIESSDDTDCDE